MLEQLIVLHAKQVIERRPRIGQLENAQNLAPSES